MAVEMKMKAPLISGWSSKKREGFRNLAIRESVFKNEPDALKMFFLGSAGSVLKMFDGDSWKTITTT
jgi:hypothetical protein